LAPAELPPTETLRASIPMLAAFSSNQMIA
jgi:hypothetical protein